MRSGRFSGSGGICSTQPSPNEKPSWMGCLGGIRDMEVRSVMAFVVKKILSVWHNYITIQKIKEWIISLLWLSKSHRTSI